MSEEERPIEDVEATDEAAPGPLSSRTGLSVPVLIGSLVFSVIVGLLVAWLIIGPPSDDDPAISAKQLLSGSADAPVRVSGTAKVGSPAPKAAFTYFQGMTGSLSALQGSPAVLNFWSSTCAPCIREMPSLEKLYNQLGGQQAQFLGIDVGDSLTEGQKMLETTGVTYPQARDPKSQLVAAFGGTALPDTVLIDASGTIVGIYNRALTSADLAAIPKLLGVG